MTRSFRDVAHERGVSVDRLALPVCPDADVPANLEPGTLWWSSDQDTLLAKGQDGGVHAPSRQNVRYVATVLGAPPPNKRTGTLALSNATQLGNPDIVVASGCVTPNDGGGGTFAWDASSVAGDDGGAVIVPSGGGGRWVRSVAQGEDIDARWFGLVWGKLDPSYAADNSYAINAAITYANSLAASGAAGYYGGGTIRLPRGIITLRNKIYVPQLAAGGDFGSFGVTLRGAGNFATILLTGADMDVAIHIVAKNTGLEDLAISGSTHGLYGIWFGGAIFCHLKNVNVGFFTRSGGAGIKTADGLTAVSTTPNDGSKVANPCQNHHWERVTISQCHTGLQQDSMNQLTSSGLILNGNTINAVVATQFEHWSWIGGMIQGSHSGAAFLSAAVGDGSCANLLASVLHIECPAGTTVFESTVANGLKFCVFEQMTMALAAGMYAFKFYHGYALRTDAVKIVNAGAKYYNITNTTARLSAIAMGPTEIAAQITDGGGNNITWTEVGNSGGGIHVATPLPLVPVSSEWTPGIAIGQGPLHLVPMTAAERNAMSTPQEGWVIANSTTHKIQYYDGSAWQNLF